MAVDGMRAKHLKNWALRCHAVTKDTSKRFCPKSGNATLIRTSSSIDSGTGVLLELELSV
jgi:RNA-binding protein NOB1